MSADQARTLDLDAAIELLAQAQGLDSNSMAFRDWWTGTIGPQRSKNTVGLRNALDHYASELAKADTPRFHVGDRVRCQTAPRLKPREGFIYAIYEKPDGALYHVGGRVYNREHIELVERAWYAPPGVTMVAMTPERIAALEKAQKSLWFRFFKGEATLDSSMIDEMLAEARGEVKP